MSRSRPGSPNSLLRERSSFDLRQDPVTLANPDTWAVMQDPEGNEFCVFDVESVTGLA